MRVWLNPDKMAAYGLMPKDVIAALNAQNVYVAAGSVGAPPQQNSQSYELTVLPNGQLQKAADYERVVVKTIPDSS